MEKDAEFIKFLSFQLSDLSNWKKVLKPEIYNKVENIVLAYNLHIINSEKTKPDEILRGQDIDMILKDIMEAE